MVGKGGGGKLQVEQVSVPGNAERSPVDLHDFNAIAQWRGAHQSDKPAFVFLADGENETPALTFGELHHGACSVATWIQEHELVGERVLLLYPPGLDFIIGFLGCLYAGAIAVPAYPPHPRRSDPRLEAIFEDCQPKAAFCIQKEVENLSLQLADHNLLILATDTLSPSTGTWESPAANHDSVAYLQYTSGSTGHPKGVMVTHGNLLHQCEYLSNVSGHDENMVLVSWQPFFHDMGLVGILTIIFLGAICYTMAPAAFLRKPIRWLQAISRYRGTTATGPNFSFELCVTQTTPEQREGLDLSSWKWAWNGAEPIRPDVLDRFCEVYEPFGFDRRTHFPCFGMAEATLCATADRPDRLPIISSFQREALEQNHAVPCASEDPMAVKLVSSGICGDGMEIVIVEPETLEQRPDGYVGEIWVAGRSVALGYWQRPEETEKTFNAYVAGSNRGPYLRTGDLGFVRDDELFVTGRLKDMIIIRGRNLYPQDIEMVAQQSHDALESNACAAFAIQVDGHEEIALALEVKRTARRRNDFGDIFEAVRSAVVENHGVAIHWIGLIQPGRFPKTSSGKVMRRACRRDFYSGDLELLAEWRTSDEESKEYSPEVVSSSTVQSLVQRLMSLPPALRHQILVTHLQGEIAKALDLRSAPDPYKGLELLGIDSMGAVKLVNNLQDQLENAIDLPTTLLFDQPSIDAVARYVERTLFGRTGDSVGIHPTVDLDEARLRAKSLKSPDLRGVLDATMDQVLGNDPWVANADESDDQTRERKTLASILALKSQLDRLQARAEEPIAIVGLSCRYPGGDGLDGFWKVLDEGRDTTTEVPIDRWDIADYYDANMEKPGKMNTRRGAFVPDIDLFDADFFDISPREARTLDPQQRILLEVSWEALESANVAPRRLRGKRGGVFVGISVSDYFERVVKPNIESMDAYSGTGNALSAAAGRLAFVLGWQGPAMAIDTACSSSLVSLHQACSSLRKGECDIALAGGVSLVLNPMVSAILSRARMLSPDGHCKTFDATANGYVRGEGCGIVVLKRLSDARRDGNRIMALIRGSAVNQDGGSSGLTVPNGLAQERVISDALKAAGIEPAAVQYLEAHGTGTSLGDPIEVQAANAVLSQGRAPDQPLLIGSVKTNIGHTEPAAGIAGVIKVILALQHGRIPQSLHFQTPNPHIPWDQVKVKVVAESTPWPVGADRRIAGVSSFGFVGTNAHLILEEAPVQSADSAVESFPAERPAYMMAISARSKKGLKELVRRYIGLLAQDDEISLADLCYSANSGRDHFEQRAVMVFETIEELKAQLARLEVDQLDPGTVRGRVVSRGKRQTAFLFTGQGSQFVGMGRELYDFEPVYREHFDRCATLFQSLDSEAPDLRQLVFENDGDGLLNQTGYTQPALYALEVSLFALWKSWGVEPDLVLGHSVGEYAAAYAAGVFSLEDGLKLISERGRLMQGLPSGGGMAAITAAEAVVEEAISDYTDVCIGAYNGADTVISGAQDEVDALIERFESEGVRCKRLITSHAFHSSRMEPMLDAFREYSGKFSYRSPENHLISNVSGEILPADWLPSADYWADHIRKPVQFERSIRSLQDHGCELIVEIGPHPVLIGLGQRCWTSEKQPQWIGTLRRDHSDTKQILAAAARIHTGGGGVDFTAMDMPWRASRHPVSLPLYPFQRRRHWVESSDTSGEPVQVNIEEHLYGITWEQRDIESRQADISPAEKWLVLTDAGGVGTALCQELERSGRRFINVKSSDLGAGLTPALSEEITDALDNSVSPITNVVHLWSLDRRSAENSEGLWAAQERGVESVLDLLHILLEHQWQGRLWLVTGGVQRVQESDGVDATQSPMWGFGKSIGMEHPELWGGLLDLPQDADVSPEELMATLACGDVEDQVALRDGRRWVARLAPRTVKAELHSLAMDANSSYLVTGGLGGIGLEMANRLVQRGARHLILNGRRAPSEVAREAIVDLQEQGCKVQVIQGDVSLEADVIRLLDEIQSSKLPPLKGIIHAAGVDAVARMSDLDHTGLRRTLAAKMGGGYLLDRLTSQRNIELSLFVCTSSISAVWGSVGQGAYAAANAFLDALVDQRRARNMAATSINYGPWSKVGMGTANDEGIAWLKSRGIRPLDPQIALNGMEMVVADDMDGTVVADINWSLFRELAELQRPRPLFEKLGGSESDQEEDGPDPAALKLISQLTEAAPAERVGLLKQVIRNEVARVLQKPADELDDDVGIFDLGMDSLMAVELSTALSRKIGHKLPATTVMDHPDIESVTNYIIEKVLVLPGGKDAKHSQPPVPAEPEPDTTEKEVGELSQQEVETALDEELMNILG